MAEVDKILDRAPVAEISLRKCKVCSEDRPLSQFRSSTVNGKKYHGYECDPCRSEKRRKSFASLSDEEKASERKKRNDYYHKNFDKIAQRRREAYWASVGKNREDMRNRYQLNREARKQNQKAIYRRDPEKQKDMRMKAVYGLGRDEYQRMLLAQNSVCAICSGPEVSRHKSGTLRRLAVDHNHACCAGHKSCGKCIRGLLCSTCNKALGGFRDNAALLASAILYLAKWGSR